MDELRALVSSDLWVRWRRAKGNRSYADLLGPGETLRAEGGIVDLDRPHLIENPRSKLGMVAGAVLGMLGDSLTRSSNWDFREPGRGDLLFAVRAPATRDAPSVFTVTTREDTPIGTVSVHGDHFKRELRTGSGAVCSYVPVTKLLGTAGESSRATIVDGAVVLATQFHDRDPDAVADVVPTSGMIDPHDFGVTFASETDVATRVLALVAAILDTKVHERPDDNEHGVRIPMGHAAPGTDPRSARKEDRARAEENQHDDRLNQIQDKARRLGKEDLAERLEKRRRKP